MSTVQLVVSSTCSTSSRNRVMISPGAASVAWAPGSVRIRANMLRRMQRADPEHEVHVVVHGQDHHDDTAEAVGHHQHHQGGDREPDIPFEIVEELAGDEPDQDRHRPDGGPQDDVGQPAPPEGPGQSGNELGGRTVIAAPPPFRLPAIRENRELGIGHQVGPGARTRRRARPRGSRCRRPGSRCRAGER